MNSVIDTEKTDGHFRQTEVLAAVRNALKLGSSLLMTWSIALVVRLYVPRVLGPERFGLLNFAEAFTATAFVLLGLGVEIYVRKEIAVRPEHAKDFIPTLVVVRTILLVLVYAAMEIVLRATGRSNEAKVLVYIYGIAQYFTVGSTTSAALLHATGKVNEMSILSVATKLLWATGLFLAIYFEWPLIAFALFFTLAEGVKAAFLFHFARKKLDLSFNLSLSALSPVLVASLPFYLSSVATTIYNRIDVSMIAVMGSDKEAGFYGAAVGLAGLTMLLAPLINWVLIPLFSRAHEAGPEQFWQVVHRAQEFIFALSVPVGLALVVGSEFFVGFVFGAEFAPASLAMKFLAIAHLLMYVSIVCSCALTMLGVVWPMTLVFLSGLFINPALNYAIIPLGLGKLGTGGAGAMAGISTLLTEIVISGLLIVMLGKRGFDRRLVRSVFLNLSAAVVVGVADHWLPGKRGLARLLLAGLGYFTLAIATGALDIRGIRHWMLASLRKRS